VLKYLLDTNIVIYTVKNRPEKVREAFNRHADQLCVSTVTLGELIYGAEKSQHPERNLAEVESFAARLQVLPFDSGAAIHFGQIRAELALSGCPIAPYDVMIARHARSRGLVLVSNNVRELQRVPGLRSENWAAP